MRKAEKPKKIALFIPSLGMGGAERIIVTLANDLAAKQIKVDLIVINGKGVHVSRLSEKVNLIDLDQSRAIKSLFPLVKYLRREKPDVVMSSLNYANIVLLISHFLSFQKTRIIVSEHSQPAYNAPGVKYFVTQRLMRRLYKYSDKIIAVSDLVKIQLTEMFKLSPEKIDVIPNPMEIGKIKELSKEPNNHPMLKSKTPVILATGRLVPVKDYPTLLKACSILKDRHDFNLMVLGEGPARNELEQIAKDLNIFDKVDFLGFVENPFSFMENADVFVMSSTHEGFANVLVEAMACRLPIVTTVDPANILENGKWGRKVSVGNPNLLADALEGAIIEGRPAHVSKRVNDFESRKIIEIYSKVLLETEYN